MLQRCARLTLLILVLVVTSGCPPSQQIGPLPVVDDPGQSALVYILRSRMAPCGGERAFIGLDGGSPFVTLRGGENVAFQVSSGDHVLSTAFEMGVPSVQGFYFAAGKSYYLLIRPSMPDYIYPYWRGTCAAQFLQLDERRGEQRLRDTKPVLELPTSSLSGSEPGSSPPTQ